MSDNTQQSVDLEPYLTVLDREQLEHLLALMIMKNPDSFGFLEQATEYIDQYQLLSSLDPLEDASTIEDIFTSISDVFSRYQAYMKLEQFGNALLVLYALSNQILLKIFEFGIGDDTAPALDIITKLEIEWKNVAQQYTPDPSKAPKTAEQEKKEKKEKGASRLIKKTGGKSKDDKDDEESGDYMDDNMIDVPYSLMDIFEKLASWRLKLEKLGPVFSDPLRVLKNRIKKEAPQSAPSAAAAPGGDQNKDLKSGEEQKRKQSSAAESAPKAKKQRK